MSLTIILLKLSILNIFSVMLLKEINLTNFTKIKNIPLGLTICYDLRFPNLFRKLAKKGAHIILVPSAFTVPTAAVPAL